MTSVKTVLAKIADLKARVLRDSISPRMLGSILEEMLGYCRLTDRPGNYEFESLKAGALEVAELVIRRLNAVDADFLLTEADVVQAVASHGDGLYTLTLATPWEGYYTAQVKYNVLRGLTHNLTAEPSDSEPAVVSPAYARACWMNVLDVDHQANTISVRLYPDADTPSGKNWPPVPGMRFARWGNSGDSSNAVYASRQTSISLSGPDGCITKRVHVTAPVVSDANTAAVFGTLPDFLSTLDDRIEPGDDGLFVDTVVTRRLILLDENTRPVFQTTDRGPWEKGARYYGGSTPNYNGIYERSLSWRLGHGWLANTDHVAGSGNMPSWNSPYWTHAIGDERLHLDFEQVESVVLEHDPRCSLSMVADYLGDDVSESPHIRYDWERVSTPSGVSDTAGDALWNSRHENAGRALELDASDLNFQFGAPPTSLRFIVTATLLSTEGSPLLDNNGQPVTQQATLEL